jgi:hypothetical protein
MFNGIVRASDYERTSVDFTTESKKVINYHLKVNLAIPQVTQTEYNKDQIYQGCF